jgi:hypothetical protein
METPNMTKSRRTVRCRVLAAAVSVSAVAGAATACGTASTQGSTADVSKKPTSVTSLTPSIPPPADPKGRRLCYSGGELGRGVTAFVDIDREAAVVAIVRSDKSGSFAYERATGTLLDAEGRSVVEVDELGAGRRQAKWIINAKGLSLADDVFVVPVACTTIAADIVAMSRAVASSATRSSTSSAPASAGNASNNTPECFSGDDRTVVLDFTKGADTFTGALKITTGGTSEYQAVAGRRTDGTVFRVSVQRLGVGQDRTEVWTFGKSGLVLGDNTDLGVVPCANVAGAVDDLRAHITTYPTIPK